MGAGEITSECSTPFGITEYIGAYRAELQALTDWSCAQRLSASRSISDPAYRLQCTSIPGAQRLSASRSISVCCRATGTCRRCAQRLSASRSISGVPPVTVIGSWVCSTPFGITEYIGRLVGRSADHGRAVLNAFRHHGVYRVAASLHVLTLYHGCSTPFGITEYIGAVGTPTRPRRSTQCSTPFGITEYIGLFLSSYPSSTSVLCPTPFGITEYIGPPSSAVRLTHLKCAQRLSASRSISGPASQVVLVQERRRELAWTLHRHCRNHRRVSVRVPTSFHKLYYSR